jgi:hypothetical protein
MEESRDTFAAMQAGTPYKSYIKKSVGKVLIRVLNPFDEKPEEIILYGNPFTSPNKESMIVDVWNEKQDVYFKKMNAVHLANGMIVDYKRTDESQAKNYNALSDEEIEKILKSKYMVLKHALDKVTTATAALRVLNLARDLDVSEKYINIIEGRLAELQLQE